MARIIFLQNLWFEFLGPMYISAALKAEGHSCNLHIAESIDDILPVLLAEQPDIVAFSVMTGMHQWVLQAAEQIKSRLDCRVVLGGPHPTFFPEVIDMPGIDIICRGEGESAMVELAAALDRSQDFSGIDNLWVKSDGGGITRNSPRTLEQDLDRLRPADRNLYAAYPDLSRTPVLTTITSRGCPFKCSFCFNHQMMELYRGKGRYTRHHSPGHVIRELADITSGRHVQRVYFADDTFALDKRWLREFLPAYGREIGLPFHCLVRINQVDDEIAGLLSQNGCQTVFFGVESGDETIRNVILLKEISDDEIRKGAALLKKHGITFRTYNIVGFPGETLEQALKTVLLNVEIGTDYPWCSIYMPYPGTKLAEAAAQKGLLPHDLAIDSFASSFHISSMLENQDKNALINLHKFFQTAVLAPWTLPLIKRLLRLPPNRIFQLWFGLVYVICYMRSEGRGVAAVLRAVVQNRRFFGKRQS